MGRGGSRENRSHHLQQGLRALKARTLLLETMNTTKKLFRVYFKKIGFNFEIASKARTVQYVCINTTIDFELCLHTVYITILSEE